MEKLLIAGEVLPYHCDECGSPRIETPNGSVCPNGHGRIHPPLPPGARRINHAIVRHNLSRCVYNRKAKAWECNGKRWAKVRRVKGSLHKLPDDLGAGNIIAVSNRSFVELARMPASETA